jgi:hypothetical protein
VVDRTSTLTMRSAKNLRVGRRKLSKISPPQYAYDFTSNGSDEVTGKRLSEHVVGPFQSPSPRKQKH